MAMRWRCMWLAIQWAEFEEENGTLVLGYSLHYLLMYHAWNDMPWD